MVWSMALGLSTISQGSDSILRFSAPLTIQTRPTVPKHKLCFLNESRLSINRRTSEEPESGVQTGSMPGCATYNLCELQLFCIKTGNSFGAGAVPCSPLASGHTKCLVYGWDSIDAFVHLSIHSFISVRSYLDSRD